MGSRLHGIKAPIDPTMNPGRKGIGAQRHTREDHRNLRPRGEGGPEGGTAAAAAALPPETDAAREAAASARAARAAALRAAAAGPTEDLDTKVKRHQQQMNQEAEDEKFKFYQRYLSRALRDPDGSEMRGAQAANPLLRGEAERRDKRGTNPLMWSFGVEDPD